MMKVNSFDIFDTLLARNVKDPTDIFLIVELTYPYPNFKNLRLTAQNNSNHLMDDIYNQFQTITGETNEVIQSLREFELKTEMENTIPIMTNISKIKDGDIFVSDMYLSHNEIIRLLNHHNINPNITLYVSSGGKANGEMWKYLTTQYEIITHTGDNYHSDITMANKFNIKGIHTRAYEFSHLELYLLNFDYNLCKLFRTLRLMNPYEENTLEYKLYSQQIQYNIPLLLHSCKQLNSILMNENRNTVLFLSRDGCLAHKLFSYLYPQYNSIYFYSSRILNRNYTDDYKEYLKNNYNSETTILFDLHGSFKSGRKLFMELFGHLPRIFIFDYVRSENNFYEGITYVSDLGNPVIETFNIHNIGSLVDFKKDKPIFMPCETEIKYVKVVIDALNRFMNYTKGVSVITNHIFDDGVFWLTYYKNVASAQEKIFDISMTHDNYTLTYLANKYGSDKGNESGCCHYYTPKYQEIISDMLVGRNNDKNELTIHLLEIGLNRCNTNSIPSLMLWNDYFHKHINITGFDIDNNFMKFKDMYDNIDIRIGDQSNENDLSILKDKQYDIIIDDGYHASKHQQISFKTLWSTLIPGGYYIIEDLHYQPEHEVCLKTKQLFENWKMGNWINSEYITIDEINSFKNEIESIDFYDSNSKNWGDSVKNALVYIKKINPI